MVAVQGRAKLVGLEMREVVARDRVQISPRVPAAQGSVHLRRPPEPAAERAMTPHAPQVGGSSSEAARPQQQHPHTRRRSRRCYPEVDPQSSLLTPAAPETYQCPPPVLKLELKSKWGQPSSWGGVRTFEPGRGSCFEEWGPVPAALPRDGCSFVPSAFWLVGFLLL
jgi:hypothetical protein